MFACWILSYGAFAFVLLEANPLEWSGAARGGFTYLFFVVLVMSMPTSKFLIHD